MKVNEILAEAKSAHPKQAATAIAMKKAGKKPKNESTELEEEFDLIESIIERLAKHNGVDAEVIWEDLETLTEDELYAFAVTSEPIMEDQHTTEALGLYGPFTVTINTGERPQSRTKTKKFRREDDAILWAQDWLEDAPQYVFATAEVTDPDGNVVWTTDEQGMAEGQEKGEYGRVLDALGIYYPRLSIEELNVPGYHSVIANKANVPVEYAAQVIDGFANDDRYYDNEDDEEQGMAEDLSESKTFGPDTPYEVKPGEDFSLVFQPGKRSGVHYHMNSGMVADPFYFKLNGKMYSVTNQGDGIPKEVQQGMAEDWQKANKRDKTDGMSQKAVNAYRRENPGSKLKTAVTTKPSKLKKGGKASKRRKSYCSRSRGQMKMHSISCAKTPDKAICKARRRWNC